MSTRNTRLGDPGIQTAVPASQSLPESGGCVQGQLEGAAAANSPLPDAEDGAFNPGHARGLRSSPADEKLGVVILREV